MSELIEFRNGRVVTPTGVIEQGHIVVAGDRIVHIGRTPDRSLQRARSIDVSGRLVIPGLVDLHGDDIEGHLSPRSGAHVDVSTALVAADRQNLLNGITTKYHAVAFEDSPDESRTREMATELAAELATDRRTLGDNRLHARCELNEASVAAVESVSERSGIDLLSVMHHEPDSGQFDRSAFERHYVEDRNWPADSIEALARRRQSLDSTSRHALLERIAAIAREASVPLASHDDESPAAVDSMADYGVSISEYPLTLETIRHAGALELTTVMGAPNLVRGGSLWDNLSAREAVDADVVDVLCADYHPPSLLAAPFVKTGESLPTRVNRVTRNPADCVGLSDRGRIAVGARADLVVLREGPVPTVERVFVAGSEAIRTGHVADETPKQPARTAEQPTQRQPFIERNGLKNQ